MSKIAVIGWDAATFQVIRPLIEAGALPHLGQLMERGAWGSLRSTVHPLSPTAWASFMTGMNPGKHGIYDFISLREGGTFQLTNGGDLRQQTLWSRLSEAGRTVAVMNVPMTYPPVAVNGFLIAGMDTPAHATDYTYPANLRTEIESHFGPYQIDVRARGLPWQSVAHFTDTYVDRLCASVHQQGHVARYLLEKTELDFLMVVFTATDRVQHALGHLLAGPVTPDDGIGRVYRACDAATGQILEALDEDWTIFVMSDHGACAYRRTFEPNAWLMEQGLLKLRPEPRRGPWDDYLGPASRRLRRLLGLPPGSPSGLQRFLERIVWEETAAFALGAFGSIYINARDRFPKGSITSRDTYRAVCDRIVQGMLAVRDPVNDAPIVRRIYRRDEVYQGPNAHLAPDLLLETYEDYFVRNNLDHQEGRLTAPAGRYGARSLAHTGRHTPQGILVAAGRGIVPVGEQPEAQIVDLAPTILYLNRLPVPTTMDGHPLLGWLDPAYVAAHPAQTIQEHLGGTAEGEALGEGYSTRDAAVIEEHLRNLGYLN